MSTFYKKVRSEYHIRDLTDLYDAIENALIFELMKTVFIYSSIIIL